MNALLPPEGKHPLQMLRKAPQYPAVRLERDLGQPIERKEGGILGVVTGI